jgi:hypothetical protein
MATIVETMESDGHRWKAEIVRRSDGLFQVLLLKRTEEPEPDKLWAPHKRAAAFFDDIAAARRTAQELLATSEGGA